MTLVVAVTLIVSSFAVVLAANLVSVEFLATFVDAVFKTIATLVAAAWALNRYYLNRTDEPQLRVDADVSAISAQRFSQTSGGAALLIYRLDVVNTGNTLIKPFQQVLEVHAVFPNRMDVEYRPIWRWPAEGTHSGGPIEPTAWSAVSDAISISADVQAVRLYLELELADGGSWTWHKIFNISTQMRTDTQVETEANL